MRDNLWCRPFDVNSSNGAACCGIPQLKSPFLKKVGIALGDAEYFLDGVVIEEDALILCGVNQCTSCRGEFERSHLRIREQSFRIRFRIAC